MNKQCKILKIIEILQYSEEDLSDGYEYYSDDENLTLKKIANEILEEIK